MLYRIRIDNDLPANPLFINKYFKINKNYTPNIIDVKKILYQNELLEIQELAHKEKLEKERIYEEELKKKFAIKDAKTIEKLKIRASNEELLRERYARIINRGYSILIKKNYSSVLNKGVLINTIKNNYKDDIKLIILKKKFKNILKKKFKNIYLKNNLKNNLIHLWFFNYFIFFFLKNLFFKKKNKIIKNKTLLFKILIYNNLNNIRLFSFFIFIYFLKNNYFRYIFLNKSNNFLKINFIKKKNILFKNKFNNLNRLKKLFNSRRWFIFQKYFLQNIYSFNTLKNNKQYYFKKKFLNFFFLKIEKNLISFNLKNLNFELNFKQKKILKLYENLNLNILIFRKKTFFFFKKSKNFLKDHFNISSFFKNIEFRQHLININFFTNFNPILKNQIFLFTSNNIILNLKNYFPYIYEYWLVRLIFIYPSHWKWVRIYLENQINFSENLNLFFNLNNLNYTNVIIPYHLNTKGLKMILLRNKKNKFMKVSKLFFKIIRIYLKKIFMKNIVYVLQKINHKTLSYNFGIEIYSLVERDGFELIRSNFIQEFIEICISIFITKDPKFLIRWIVRVLQKIHFRKHWKFLYNLKYNILAIAQQFMLKTNFTGFHIIIKGKIGARGSIRKKTVHIKTGMFGFSKFYLSGDKLYSYAWTSTGKIGVKIITAYN